MDVEFVQQAAQKVWQCKLQDYAKRRSGTVGTVGTVENMQNDARPGTPVTGYSLPERSLILVCFALLMIAGVLMRPATPIDETRYLSVAWEMYLNGNYFLPTKNMEIYSHKPPLLFWLINLVWIPGVSETAARLVPPVFSLFVLWYTGKIADKMGLSHQTGTAAMLILATFAPFVYFGGTTRFDTMLGLSVLLGIGALWQIGTAATAGMRAWLMFGAAMALGVMSKGPVVLVHLLPPLMVMPFWAGRGRLSPKGMAVALAFCLALVALWLGPALALSDEDYRRAVLWTQSAGRTVSSYAHANPVWYYVMHMPELVFPWVFLPVFWVHLKADKIEKLLWVSVLGPLVLFSFISGKQVHYLVPEIPMLALLLARRWPSKMNRPWGPMVFLAVFAVCAIAAGLGAFGSDAAAILPIWVAALIAALIVTAVAAMALRPRFVWLSAPVLMMAVNLAFAIGPAGQIYSPVRIGQALAQADGRAAFVGSVYHAEFQFAGRLKHPLTMLNDPVAIEDFAKATHDGLIVARYQQELNPGWSPRTIYDYRNQQWAIWSTEDHNKP